MYGVRIIQIAVDRRRINERCILTPTSDLVRLFFYLYLIYTIIYIIKNSLKEEIRE